MDFNLPQDVCACVCGHSEHTISAGACSATFFCSVESVDECALLCVCSLCWFTVFKELHSELHSPRLIFSLKFQALFGARGIDWDFSSSALKASSGENESGK